MPATPRLIPILLGLAAGLVWAAEVRVYLADERAKTIYVGSLHATLTLHVAGEKEPVRLRLRRVDVERGHRPVSLDHDGLDLHSVVEGRPTHFAEIIVSPPQPELVSCHFRGVVIDEAIEIQSAELEVDIRGDERTFVVAPPGAILRWRSGHSYPLSTCLVGGDPLDPEFVPRLRHDGRLFLFCCGRCKRKVLEDPEPHVRALDQAIAEAQRPTYPLELCPVSGDSLDTVESPAEVVLRGNRLVLLKNADYGRLARRREVEIIERIERAVVKSQLPEYPLSTCVVCDVDLGSDAVNFVLGTRLLRLCCKDCIAPVEVDPEGHLARIAAAGRGR